MTTRGGIAASALAFFYLADAGAATICLKNQQTGLFEPSVAGAGNARHCARLGQAQQPAGTGTPDAKLPTAGRGIAGPVHPVTVAARASAPGAAISPSAAPSLAQPGPAALRTSSPAAPVKGPAKMWAILVGDKSVRTLLERWSVDAGHQLLWEVPVDLELNVSTTFSGTFEDALNSVLAPLANSAYPVEAMIYENRVVRIVERLPKNG